MRVTHFMEPEEEVVKWNIKFGGVTNYGDEDEIEAQEWNLNVGDYERYFFHSLIVAWHLSFFSSDKIILTHESGTRSQRFSVFILLSRLTVQDIF